ncbi:uncharacterized protein LOC129596899 [Paramacrobiotus metropolitanus]|uniref:uncharacterized protein LOC129596899 n=1 Tax=Paramacrobiotus metropolitanus TaxID=2943436 RepID=UPI0024459EB0|nr:uncharacterized protein LOC129596899 [Paramacrobiotus metropolitanus]
MKLCYLSGIFAGLLVVAAMSMAESSTPTATADHAQPDQSECCSARPRQLYNASNSVLVKQLQGPPVQYAVRVGQILYVTSLRAFNDSSDLDNHTNGTKSEAIQIMKLTRGILEDAGCSWHDVHDVTVLVVGDPHEEFPLIDEAMNEFWRDNGCGDFPWAGHLRNTPAIAGGAKVEMTVQASSCQYWK